MLPIGTAVPTANAAADRVALVVQISILVYLLSKYFSKYTRVLSKYTSKYSSKCSSVLSKYTRALTGDVHSRCSRSRGRGRSHGRAAYNGQPTHQKVELVEIAVYQAVGCQAEDDLHEPVEHHAGMSELLQGHKTSNKLKSKW